MMRWAAIGIFVIGCSASEVAGSVDAGSAPTTDGGKTTSIDGPDAVEGPPPVPACGATPSLLVKAGDLLGVDSGLPKQGTSMMSLVVDGSYLYYAIGENGTVMRVPLAGGKPSALCPIQGWALKLLVTPANLVVVDTHAEVSGVQVTRIRRAPLSGGEATIVAETQGNLSGDMFASDDRTIYFADDIGTRSVLIEGGPIRTISQHRGSLSVVNSHIIIADTSGGGVYSVTLDGGTDTTLARDQASPSLPIGCSAGICWMTSMSTSLVTEGIGAIMEVGQDQNPRTLAEDPSLYHPSELLSDGDDYIVLAVIDAALDGSILRVRPSGGKPTTIARGGSMAMNNLCLYYSSLEYGIFSVSRNYGGTSSP